MKRIAIDPRNRTARIQPGVSTRELEEAAAPHDLGPLVDHRGLVVPANLIAAQVAFWFSALPFQWRWRCEVRVGSRERATGP